MSSFVVSAKPQEFIARLEKRHEARKEVLGDSKQAEFVRLVEEQVKQNSTRPRAVLNLH